MNKNFRIVECSDLDYEVMVYDIIWINMTVAMLTQEKGIEHIELEIFPPPEKLKSWKFPFNDFVETLQKAKKCLIENQKIPEENT